MLRHPQPKPQHSGVNTWSPCKLLGASGDYCARVFGLPRHDLKRSMSASHSLAFSLAHARAACTRMKSNAETRAHPFTNKTEAGAMCRPCVAKSMGCTFKGSRSSNLVAIMSCNVLTQSSSGGRSSNGDDAGPDSVMILFLRRKNACNGIRNVATLFPSGNIVAPRSSEQLPAMFCKSACKVA